jgi:hypothetical protein
MFPSGYDGFAGGYFADLVVVLSGQKEVCASIRTARTMEVGGHKLAMKNIRMRRTALVVGALSVLCYGPSLMMAGTANMSLTSAGSSMGTYTLDGVYVGPYTALINGVSTPVICDDYGDDSYIPEWWTADVYTPSASNYANTRSAANSGLTGNALTYAYNEVGYLAVQLLSASPSTIGNIHFALWSVFDPTALSVDPAAASYLTAAKAYADSYVHNGISTVSADISEFTIYSPDTSGTYPITCAGQGCSLNNPPQEFLVRTPEPSQLALLGIDLSGVGFLFLLMFRRRSASRA